MSSTVKSRNTKGVTFVELLVTLIIGAIVAAAVLVFISISGRSTDEMAALQVLQQESSMISERFLRSVRGGSTVSARKGASWTIPDSTEVKADHIKVNFPNPANDIEFLIDKNVMQIIEGGKAKNISTRLCTAKNPSTFTVQPFGQGVQLTLTLEYARKDNTHRYTTTIGSVQCKNTIP